MEFKSSSESALLNRVIFLETRGLAIWRGTLGLSGYTHGAKMGLVTLLRALIGHNNDARSLGEVFSWMFVQSGGVWSWYHSAVSFAERHWGMRIFNVLASLLWLLLFLNSRNQKASAPKKRMLCLLSFLFLRTTPEKPFIQCLSSGKVGIEWFTWGRDTFCWICKATLTAMDSSGPQHLYLSLEPAAHSSVWVV